ncbi:ABC transporter ATP-binding protein [Bradyrhizobium sp. DOA9]|uniref:ABC transporter ATP-binding protein n=1 Tax=Bradyrhizobium sp. DOA9 TaxID=1126627 RepID=UPI0004698D8B|nr:ABC transporter ATP-binding protein [Bradyrhizobium sp. DOA9]GAJ37550.1 high-affinity branched-chain amino acid transport ATP-binding protein BivF [Bradyrhizobium sp. DOA9]
MNPSSAGDRSEIDRPKLLQVCQIHVSYVAGVDVVHGVSLDVNLGEVVCLLGRNGAGKTTLIKALCGLLPVNSGQLTFDGTSLLGVRPAEIVAAGIAVVPEGRRVFSNLTVAENLAMGAYSRRNGLGPSWRFDRAYDLFPRLAERRTQLAGTLSGGEQQMLAMARALMAQPRLLLLDEPSMGLAPLLINLIFDTINRLAMNGMTVLLVEQNATAALDIADRAYVLERGTIVKSGLAGSLERDSEIQRSYLGV